MEFLPRSSRQDNSLEGEIRLSDDCSIVTNGDLMIIYRNQLTDEAQARAQNGEPNCISHEAELLQQIIELREKLLAVQGELQFTQKQLCGNLANLRLAKSLANLLHENLCVDRPKVDFTQESVRSDNSEPDITLEIRKSLGLIRDEIDSLKRDLSTRRQANDVELKLITWIFPGSLGKPFYLRSLKRIKFFVGQVQKIDPAMAASSLAPIAKLISAAQAELASKNCGGYHAASAFFAKSPGFRISVYDRFARVIEACPDIINLIATISTLVAFDAKEFAGDFQEFERFMNWFDKQRNE